MSKKKNYDVVFSVDDKTMVNYGKKFKMNKTPMTYRQANTFLNNMTFYRHGFYSIQEIK